MSELINKTDNRTTIRRKLLAGASAFALAYTSTIGLAHAEDADQPAIWLELGGQLSRLQDGQETFSPPLMNGRPSIFEPSQKFESPPRYSIDEYGKLSFQPDNSNWVFSASVQYGRSNSNKHEVQHTNPLAISKYFLGYNHYYDPVANKFAETNARNSEKHLVLDFEAGRDVGLGLFGSHDASSTVAVGVRIAQFRSGSNFAFKSDPDWHFTHKYLNTYGYHLNFIGQKFHNYLANLTAERSFRGIGPSVSWKSSIPLAGSVQDGEIVADWGINAALLFGRQKTRTHHQSTAQSGSVQAFPYDNDASVHTTAQFPATPDHTRSRNVTVPNVGGSVGLSWRLQDFKVSVGYKADFFFGAIDGGIDAAKKENRGFYGPFASISVGLGD